MEQNKTCKERVEDRFKNRMADIRILYNAEEQTTEELGSLNEYGLCIDFIEAGTFHDQRADFWIYQLSCGGPQEEFRLYKNGDIEFWLLDWGDGAYINVTGDDASIIKDIISGVYPEVPQ